MAGENGRGWHVMAAQWTRSWHPRNQSPSLNSYARQKRRDHQTTHVVRMSLRLHRPIDHAPTASALCPWRPLTNMTFPRQLRVTSATAILFQCSDTSITSVLLRKPDFRTRIFTDRERERERESNRDYMSNWVTVAYRLFTSRSVHRVRWHIVYLSPTSALARGVCESNTLHMYILCREMMRSSSHGTHKPSTSTHLLYIYIYICMCFTSAWRRLIRTTWVVWWSLLFCLFCRA